MRCSLPRAVLSDKSAEQRQLQHRQLPAATHANEPCGNVFPLVCGLDDFNTSMAIKLITPVKKI